MKPLPLRRGTLREPGPDLARLPVAPDLAGINVAEGLRAAVAFASIILLEWWLAWPPLLTMALAANLTCFCDIGGPIRPRLKALLAFAGLGGLFWCLICVGMRIPAIYGLGYPLGAAVALYIAARSTLRGRRRVDWRGRTYAGGNLS